MDSSPPFSLPWAIAFWGTYVVAFYVSEASVVRHTKATRGDGPSVRQDSLTGLTIFALVAKLVALVLAWFQVGEVSFAAKPWLFGLGIGFMLLGAALRQHCFRMLGPAFTIEVRTAPDQEIVDRGAYKYVRHPGYLAAIIMLLGFGVATTSLAAVAVMLIAAVYVYLRRIEMEEAALEQTLGRKYTEYASKRKRLVPFLY
jgi:protein-S-isoprenylcysteine O-methyltransferase Ste14